MKKTWTAQEIAARAEQWAAERALQEAEREQAILERARKLAAIWTPEKIAEVQAEVEM